jgi:hypothetical protein
MFDPKIFYETYLHDYHKFKSILLKSVLEDSTKFEIELFGEALEKEDSAAFKKTLKSDLRQTYIHSIETFFEIFFTLIPTNKLEFDDLNILFNLTKSNWRKSYEKIKKIASGEMSLDFLTNMINFKGHKISVGHYLFYYGLFGIKSITEFSDKVSESIEAIEHGIKILAKDFIDRDEYNSYKHGLRIIPALSQIAMADPKTMEMKKEWDLSDSMSFFCKTKCDNEVKIKTKIFDSDRDFRLTRFCSNMISNMIYTRKVSFYNEQFVKKNQKIAIAFFGKKEIDDCNKINVEIQDIIFTTRKNVK